MPQKISEIIVGLQSVRENWLEVSERYRTRSRRDRRKLAQDEGRLQTAEILGEAQTNDSSPVGAAEHIACFTIVFQFSRRHFSPCVRTRIEKIKSMVQIPKGSKDGSPG